MGDARQRSLYLSIYLSIYRAAAKQATGWRRRPAGELRLPDLLGGPTGAGGGGGGPAADGAGRAAGSLPSRRRPRARGGQLPRYFSRCSARSGSSRARARASSSALRTTTKLAGRGRRRRRLRAARKRQAVVANGLNGDYRGKSAGWPRGARGLGRRWYSAQRRRDSASESATVDSLESASRAAWQWPWLTVASGVCSPRRASCGCRAPLGTGPRAPPA